MLKKLIKNEILDSLLRPLLTLLIIVPLSLCVLAPAGSFIGKYLAAALMGLYDLTGFLGVAIFCAVLPFLIVTGMHYSFMPYWLGSIATLGYEPIYLLFATKVGLIKIAPTKTPINGVALNFTAVVYPTATGRK